MARQSLKLPLALWIAALFVAILVLLHLMSTATQDASHLNRMYSGLVLVNTIASLLLLGLVGANSYSLYQQLRKKTAGSHLTARMIFLFSLLTLAPASIVFHYSMQFLERSIDSWFDVRIDQALEDALQLGQTALDERMASLLKQTEQNAEQLATSPASLLAVRLGELHESQEDAVMTLFSRQGKILAFNSGEEASFIPDLPEMGVMVQVRQGRPYAGIEPTDSGGLRIRTVVSLASDDAIFLQTLYPIPLHMAQLAHTVEMAYSHYKEFSYLRGSLKATFAMTLSLILLLSLLAALWSAFLSIRRLVDPVRQLAIGTRSIAEGNYEQRLPVVDKGELGFLVESFNAMSRKIAQARDDAQKSRLEVEQQHAYLETVLGNLSSGVFGFSRDQRLLTANQAANSILHADFGQYIHWPLSVLAGAYPHLAELMSTLDARMHDAPAAWRIEVGFMGPEGRQELFCRGTPILGNDGQCEGMVIVIDDVTALIQAQRASAWSEVARRLAHEIKNPLTPIQLSAERLRHKLSKSVTEGDLEFLDKYTRTIVQQVEAMKSMVNAFSDYAKPVTIQLKSLSMAPFIEEIIRLYPPNSGLEFDLNFPADLPDIQADPVKLRQVLHNLIKNAQEAIPNGESGRMVIAARTVEDTPQAFVELTLTDNGPGIPADEAGRIFEPYVTHKPKGTGLGLAIVRRILEEHGGSIRLDSSRDNKGACFIIRLPTVKVSKNEK